MTTALSSHEARIAARYMEGEVEKGSLVEVYKGRKVPVGTVGRVFWVGAGTYGYRVGLKDDAGETHWTALANCRLVVEDKGEDESWTDYDARKRAEEAEREARRVSQWDEVVVLDEPDFVGKVFWKRDSRLGVARLGARRVRVNGQLRNKPEDVRWVDESEVCKRHLYVPELTEVVADEPEPVVETTEDAWDDDDLGCF